jgi:hypothetical protein
MPSDPGNLPLQRLMPGDGVPADEVPTPQTPNTLHAESVLMQEFNYANVTAYQAKEERSSVFNVYLIQLGIAISGLVTLETIYVIHPLIGLTVVGIIVGTLSAVESLVYFARLFALGRVFQDSTIAMNLIKEFYIQQLKRQMPQLEQAFHWRLVDTDVMEQPVKLPFVMSFTVALSGSLSFAFAVYLSLFLHEELALPPGSFVPITLIDYIIIVLAFVADLITFAAYYATLIHRHSPARVLKSPMRARRSSAQRAP